MIVSATQLVIVVESNALAKVDTVINRFRRSGSRRLKLAESSPSLPPSPVPLFVAASIHRVLVRRR